MHMNQQVSGYNVEHCLLNPYAQVIDFHAHLTALYKKISYALPIKIQVEYLNSELLNLRLKVWRLTVLQTWWHVINIVMWSSYIYVVYILLENERYKHDSNHYHRWFTLQNKKENTSRRLHWLIWLLLMSFSCARSLHLHVYDTLNFKDQRSTAPGCQARYCLLNQYEILSSPISFGAALPCRFDFSNIFSGKKVEYCEIASFGLRILSWNELEAYTTSINL